MLILARDEEKELILNITRYTNTKQNVIGISWYCQLSNILPTYPPMYGSHIY